MNVSSVRTRDFDHNDYSNEEVDAMRKDAATSSTMNEVRSEAGIKGPAVAIRGDDRTNGDYRARWNNEDTISAATDAVQDRAIGVFEGVLEADLCGPFGFLITGLQAMKDAKERSAILAANNERGAMHLAMITALDLPTGYKNIEVGRWKEAGTGEASGATRMGTRLEALDSKRAAVLQLHADRGMNAAQSEIRAGRITRESTPQDVKRLIDGDASLKAKYESDAAFKSGFDALVWAQGHDTAQYERAVHHLESRDARYSQHAIALQG
jgi:hypothetical protein